MIQVENIVKKFEDKVALDGLTTQIDKGNIYGVVGSNGAGKSTFLRLLTGVYRPNSGTITIEGEPIYNNPIVKDKCVFVPDDLYFLPHANLKSMAELYATSYTKFNDEKLEALADNFKLNMKANLNTFSKGMKRQAATILALACEADYLFFDETFDGLDPIMRNHVKKCIYGDVYDRNATAIITSHSLRELEDTCDQLSLLHQGKLVFESDVQNLKTSFFKIQVAFKEPFDQMLFSELNPVHYQQQGKVANLIVAGDKEQVKAWMKSKQPIIYEQLPLSLEEVFVYELESLGYAFELKEEGDETTV